MDFHLARQSEIPRPVEFLLSSDRFLAARSVPVITYELFLPMIIGAPGFIEFQHL